MKSHLLLWAGMLNQIIHNETAFRFAKQRGWPSLEQLADCRGLKDRQAFWEPKTLANTSIISFTALQAVCTHSNGPTMRWSTSWLEPTGAHSVTHRAGGSEQQSHSLGGCLGGTKAFSSLFAAEGSSCTWAHSQGAPALDQVALQRFHLHQHLWFCILPVLSYL